MNMLIFILVLSFNKLFYMFCFYFFVVSCVKLKILKQYSLFHSFFNFLINIIQVDIYLTHMCIKFLINNSLIKISLDSFLFSIFFSYFLFMKEQRIN